MSGLFGGSAAIGNQQLAWKQIYSQSCDIATFVFTASTHLPPCLLRNVLFWGVMSRWSLWHLRLVLLRLHVGHEKMVLVFVKDSHTSYIKPLTQSVPCSVPTSPLWPQPSLIGPPKGAEACPKTVRMAMADFHMPLKSACTLVHGAFVAPLSAWRTASGAHIPPFWVPPLITAVLLGSADITKGTRDTL